jgi:glycosyltransferase involved in cell wall biosynthesis
MKLSVVIPSYKDPLLHKIIDDILLKSELGEEMEIIVVLDNYWPITPIKNDPHIKIIHLGTNRGMRGAINAGVAVSKGEYIMRADEHCMFGQGFDRIVLKDIKDNDIVTMRRYFLDPIKWELMDIPYVDYEKLVIQDGKKFSAQRWRSRDEERKDIMYDETMAMQGSCWIMKRSWWDKVVGELQTEGYGPLIQDSHEMQFKAWKSGGRLMLNKNTWFAHKHRSFARTHNNGSPENPAKCEDGYAYSLSQNKDYYLNEICPKWFQS